MREILDVARRSPGCSASDTVLDEEWVRKASRSFIEQQAKLEADADAGIKDVLRDKTRVHVCASNEWNSGYTVCVS